MVEKSRQRGPEAAAGHIIYTPSEQKEVNVCMLVLSSFPQCHIKLKSDHFYLIFHRMKLSGLEKLSLPTVGRVLLGYFTK